MKRWETSCRPSVGNFVSNPGAEPKKKKKKELKSKQERLCFGRLRSSLCSLSSRQRTARQKGKLLHNQYVLWGSSVSSGDTAQPVCCCTCTAVGIKGKMNRPSSLSLWFDLFMCVGGVGGVCFHFSTFLHFTPLTVSLCTGSPIATYELLLQLFVVAFFVLKQMQKYIFGQKDWIY